MTQTTVHDVAELTVSPIPALGEPNRHRIVRWLLIASGSGLVGIGVLGIFLPLLPSTVFFLMAAGCYGKSSPAAYTWLTTNRWFGRHLRNYKEDSGATVGAKILSIVSLWVGIGLSEYLIDSLWVRLVLAVIGLAVTVHLLRLKTMRR